VSLILELKDRVLKAQLRAHKAVNIELIKLYWEIGKSLSDRQQPEKWGSKYLEQVSKGLKAEFPCMKGFSRANLYVMKQFAELSMMIKQDLYARQKLAPKITNFKDTLPAAQSDLACEMFKDPYCFDFLTITATAGERDIENALINQIRDFLLALFNSISSPSLGGLINRRAVSICLRSYMFISLTSSLHACFQNRGFHKN
jgi:predicted nuclease of restriction endonuclease-like (RecB) superfamily